MGVDGTKEAESLTWGGVGSAVAERRDTSFSTGGNPSALLVRFGTAAERPVEWESGSERGRDRREHNLAGLVEWAPRVGPGQCISRMRWGKYGIQQIFADIPRPYRVYARILEPSNGGEPRCSCT